MFTLIAMLFKWIGSTDAREQSARDAYLAAATDTYDLERRMKELDRLEATGMGIRGSAFHID